MRFDYSMQAPKGDISSPYGFPIDPLQAKSNLSYLEFIDILAALWRSGHPDVVFGPYGDSKIYNPEQGNIIYSLEAKEPKQNSSRPRMFEIIMDEKTGKKYVVFKQSFNLLVGFNALHKDPRVAEELLEEFEDFMIKCTPILKSSGLENIFYGKRLSDTLERRFGADVSVRTALYQVSVQKLLFEELEKLESIFIQVQAIINGSKATPDYPMIDVSNINAVLIDNHQSEQVLN